jgi:hypothetical protein
MWSERRATDLLRLFALGVLAFSCGSTRRPPEAAPSPLVEKLRRDAGRGVQDCGEAVENWEEQRCHTRPVGECVLSAFKACRPAHGSHVFFASEGDDMRVDWIVMVRSGGACDFVLVEDHTRDPLGPKQPIERVCSTVDWKSHSQIEGCEVLDPKNCAPRNASATK